MRNYMPHNKLIINANVGTSLVVLWLRLYTSKAGGTGSIPGQGTKILLPWDLSGNTCCITQPLKIASINISINISICWK